MTSDTKALEIGFITFAWSKLRMASQAAAVASHS
jgi:hypothetical protein